MNSELFGVRNVKPDGNPKKPAKLEILSNSNYAVRVAGTSHGISPRRRTSPHVPLIAITCRKDTIRNQRKPRRLNARTSHATERSHLGRLQ